MKTFKVEDIFEDIPNDPDNVLLKIPPEIYQELGWEPGDTLNITLTPEGTIEINKHG